MFISLLVLADGVKAKADASKRDNILQIFEFYATSATLSIRPRKE